MEIKSHWLPRFAIRTRFNIEMLKQACFRSRTWGRILSFLSYWLLFGPANKSRIVVSLTTSNLNPFLSASTREITTALRPKLDVVVGID